MRDFGLAVASAFACKVTISTWSCRILVKYLSACGKGRPSLTERSTETNRSIS